MPHFHYGTDFCHERVMEGGLLVLIRNMLQSDLYVLPTQSFDYDEVVGMGLAKGPFSICDLKHFMTPGGSMNTGVRVEAVAGEVTQSGYANFYAIVDHYDRYVMVSAAMGYGGASYIEAGNSFRMDGFWISLRGLEPQITDLKDAMRQIDTKRSLLGYREDR